MVEYITYKKKKYPVRINFYVEMKLAEDGIDLQKLKDEEKVEAYRKLQKVLFYALQAGAHAEDIELDLEIGDMIWVLDESAKEFTDILLKKGDAQEKLNGEKASQELAAAQSKKKSKIQGQVKKMAENQRAQKKQTGAS